MTVDRRTYDIKVERLAPLFDTDRRHGLAAQAEHLGRPVGHYTTHVGPLKTAHFAFGALLLSWTALSCTLSSQPPAVPGAPAEVEASVQSVASKEGGPSAEFRRSELESAALFDAASNPWTDPPEAKPDAGGVFTLQALMGQNTIQMGGRSHKVDLRSYNRGLVGPTIRFRAGQELKIRLKNDLPAERDPQCRNHHHHGNTPACFNLTNLHTHGLHVSPKAPADDVFQVVQPGESFFHRYPILPFGAEDPSDPPSHYPGTFWYHAHRHGSTAIQLASGMAGALILEGDIDEFPGVAGTRERIFVFQQLAWDRDGEIKTFGDILPNWAGCETEALDCRRHGPPKHTTINGVVKPEIRLLSGQVERWRWIDAGVFEMLDMELRPVDGGPAVPLHQIAIDGITLETVTARERIRMGPGYRTDLLVRPPAPGRYFLYKRRAPFALAGGDLEVATVDDPQILAVVDVSRTPCTRCPDLLPDGSPLPFPERMLPTITAEEVAGRTREMVFSADRSVTPPKFLVNGRQYEHGRIDHRPILDTAEEWTLGNSDPGNGRTEQAHPFHIHVNAFQMLDDDGNPAEWRDTVIVPPGYPGKKLRMRTRYERFDGKFVLHCHILTHEDLGMMQAVEIVRPTAIETPRKESAP